VAARKAGVHRRRGRGHAEQGSKSEHSSRPRRQFTTTDAYGIGLISRENVWLDGAAVIAQLTAPDLANASA
jgi:hypothetical protein